MRSPNARTRFDVAVIGAGPAGAAAARHLATRGAQVVLLEKEKLPRYKTCGGGVVLRAARAANLPLEAVRRLALDAAELHFHDTDLHFEVRRERPILWTTMRADFDARLCDAAAAAGAAIRDASGVRALEVTEAGARVRTEHDDVHARFIVAADGATSRTARWAGWGRIDACIPALEVEVEAAPDVLQRFARSVRFDFGTIPGGYAWVFPKSTHLSIGMLCARRGKVALQRTLMQYAQRLRIPLDATAAWHGAVIPLAPRRTFARGCVFVCGDAAGLVDPVTCEGISFALQSGALVARAIAASNGDVAEARILYDASLRREIVSELRLARVLAEVLYRRIALRNWLFRRLGTRSCEAMIDVITGARTYRDLLASPTHYGKLLRASFGRVEQR